ncbi:MAG: ABC transporter ATP-binding protein/permease [Proteobacteria bacterium]|nr:ABC transporter ATP-binding protein/permease [Pseudomonadota bacterium]
MKSFNLIKPYFIENRFKIILGIFFLIIVDLLQLFIPRIIKWTVDDLTYNTINREKLFFYALYIAAAALCIGICRYFWRKFLIGTSRRVEEGLRNQIFSHIQTLSQSYFIKTKTGELMAHATNDVTNIRMATGMGMVAFTDAVFLGTSAIGFMIYINLKLTLYAILPMPLLIFSARYFSRKMHRKYRTVQASFGDLTEVVRERFAGIRVVKAYTLEDKSYKDVKRSSIDYVSKNIALTRITGSFFPLMVLFTNISLAIVIYFGGRQTIMTTITTGDFVAFISYLNLMTWPMMAVGWVISMIQRGKASLDRINTIIQTEPGINDCPETSSLKEPPGTIRFDHVTFSYDPNHHHVLHDINLTLKKGWTLGITGPPGSGKTTLLNLVPRLFDPASGRILFDGRDIRSIKLTDLKAMISFVSQEPFLFSGTIAENITFEPYRSDDNDLISATKSAILYETILSFPNGFNTIVGEKGIVLSGGQKQRIAIARAIYHNTPILILDDPVSQVDAETGSLIIKEIQTLSGGKTVFIVSHRLSTIKNADLIVVMDNGKITETGTHEKLAVTNGYYAKMLKLQQLEEDLL